MTESDTLPKLSERVGIVTLLVSSSHILHFGVVTRILLHLMSHCNPSFRSRGTMALNGTSKFLEPFCCAYFFTVNLAASTVVANRMEDCPNRRYPGEAIEPTSRKDIAEL